MAKRRAPYSRPAAATAAAAGHGPIAVRRFVANSGFLAFTQALIALNAIALGLEAVPSFGEAFGSLFDLLFAASTVWFVAEIALRLVAHGKPIAGFFRDGWNTFDTAIVVLSLLPLAGGIAIVARLLRLLRLFRLVSGSSLLRDFALGRLPVGAHVLAGSLILALSLYAFSLAGFHLAGGLLAEAAAWADLPSALSSTAAWSVMASPPSLPAEGPAGVAWLVVLGVAHVAWLGLLLRGLFGARQSA